VSKTKFEFDLVIICVGVFSSQPHVPQFPNREKFHGVVMHNSELKSAEQLSSKRVVIVGYGKSATDAALELAKVAHSTNIIFRQPRWPIPGKLAGVLSFKWGLLHRMTSALLPLYQKTSGLERVMHSTGAALVWLYGRLTSLLLYFQCRLGGAFGRRTNLVPPMPIELSGFDHTTMVPRPDFYRLVRKGMINAFRDEIESFTDHGVTLKSHQELAADVIILATD
jgi:dimethylaniline monooxygenase (N-oxide forming)